MPVTPPTEPPAIVPNYWAFSLLSFNRTLEFPSDPQFREVTTNDIQVYDINGDGHLDVFLTYYHGLQNFVGSPIRVLLGDGDGNFTDGTASLFGANVPLGDAATGLSIADFNGDGVNDLFISQSAENLGLMQNGLVLSTPGNGAIDASATHLPQVEDFTHWSTAGDIDGDDDIDIYVGNFGPPPSSYFLINDGTGHFTRSDTRLPLDIEGGAPAFTSSLLFDADNDGDNDLMLGAYTVGGTVSSLVLFNDGAGQFLQTTNSLLPAPNLNNPVDVVLEPEAIDLNGDGFSDLLMIVTDYYTERYIQVLINNGDGTFHDETASRINAYSTVTGGNHGRYLQLVDINNDGATDLIDQTAGPQRFYLNDGTGHFVALPADFLFTQFGTLRFAAGDFNEDGRVDFFTLGYINYWDDPNNITEFHRVALWTQPAGTTLNGDNVANAVLGDASSETLNGLGGNDVIFGAQGGDTLSGGDGDDYLNGGAGVDALNGGAGADVLNGGLNADTMAGGTGNDTYVVNIAGDVTTETSASGGRDLVESAVTRTLGAHLENLTLTGATTINGTGNELANLIRGNDAINTLDGGLGADNLIGAGGADTLRGGNGNDKLNGGLGVDRLNGGGGADAFVFTTAPAGANRDTILDYDVAADTIQIENGAFLGLGIQGALSVTKFHIGAAAHDATDRIIYDSATGRLYFDADGNGASVKIWFATLDPGLALTAADFVVI